MIKGAIMNSVWNFVEKHLFKFVATPVVLNGVEFLMMLMHSLDDGVISHEELEVLLKAGDGLSLTMLSLVMAYLKFKKN